jgi:hypothetical protein
MKWGLDFIGPIKQVGRLTRDKYTLVAPDLQPSGRGKGL